MTQLRLKHSLQRSLFERLTDDAPEQASESVYAVYAQGISEKQLRESVRRDLTNVFNVTRLEALQDLAKFPEVSRSTLNYGIGALAGRTLSGIDPEALAQMLRCAIEYYEPRLVASSLAVRVRVDARALFGEAISFDIEAELRLQPVPLALSLRGQVDLEHGRIRLEEVNSKGGQ